MLLAIDVGNTNIKLALSPQGGSRSIRTVSVVGASDFEEALNFKAKPSHIIGCCVVPRVQPLVDEACQSKFSMPVTWLKADLPLGLQIEYQSPETLGADRLANVLGALELVEPPLIVVDFGTATKLEAVTASGAYVGGAIMPGLTMGVEALHSRTGLLPRVSLSWSGQLIGRNTIESLQSGAVRGHFHAVVGLIHDFETVIGKPKTIFITGNAALLHRQSLLHHLLKGYEIEPEGELTMLGLIAAAKRLGLG